MTERQNNFATLYGAGTPIRDAILMAGYSDKNLPQTAAKLLADKEVRSLIQQVREGRKENNILTKRQCREVLSKIAVDPDSSPNEKIKAVGMLIDFDFENEDEGEHTIVFEIDFGNEEEED